MKAFKKIILLSVTFCIAVSMSGCVYFKNKNWSDLNQEEKEEVRQVLGEVKEELEEDFPDKEVTGDYVLGILDRIEKIIDEK